MSIRFSTRNTCVAALLGVLAVQVAFPYTALAQNTDGGFLIKLRLAERFTSRDATSPDAGETGVTNQAISDLALSISSETRSEALNLDFGAGYRFVDSPQTDGYEGEFSDPTLRLSYAQTAATSSIAVSSFASRTDLDSASLLDVSQSLDGTLDPDFADVTQAGGNRTQLRFDGKLTLRDDAPFGLNITLKVDDISYDNLPEGSTLTDYTYAMIRTGARLDITPIMQANLGLQFSQSTSSDRDTLNRYGIDAGLILTQPNGQITLDAAITNGDDRSQRHISAGRSFTLENTTARFGLGLSQASTDDVFVTGSASLKHSFGNDSALGAFTASLDRRLTREGRSDEDVVTSLSLATSYALNPVTNLRLSAAFAQSEDIVTGNTVDLGQADLSVAYALNPDWAATAGVGVQSRDPSGGAVTESTTLSVGISRTFDLRR